MTALAVALTASVLLALQGCEVLAYFWATQEVQPIKERHEALPWALMVQGLRIGAVFLMYCVGRRTALDGMATFVLSFLLVVTAQLMFRLARPCHAPRRTQRNAWSWTLVGVMQAGLIVLMAVS